MSKKPLLNGTQVPNTLMEALYSAPSDFTWQETKILLFVCRKTIGWQKDVDWLTLNHISEGTGIHKSHVSKSLRMLQEKGAIILEKQEGRDGWNISLNRDKWSDESVAADATPVATNATERLPAALPRVATNATAIKEVQKNPTKKPSTKNGSSGAHLGSEEPGFLDFWEAYPRKTAKPNALRAWRTLRPDEPTRVLILDDLAKRRVSDQWTREGGQFIPHPATYLNQRRWEDQEPQVEAKRVRFVDIKALAKRDTANKLKTA